MQEPTSEGTDTCCPVCRKSFSNESNRRARSKHISYCRKKHLLSPVSRRKACDECVRAKVRCALNPAGCSRCTSRGNPCTYHGRLLRDVNLGNSTPAATGRSFLQGEPLQVNSSIAEDNSNLSLEKFGLDNAAPLTDAISGNSQFPHPALTWDNEAIWTGLLDVPDLIPLNEENDPVINAEAANASYDAPRVSDHMTVAGRSRQPSPSILASISYRDPSPMFERRRFSLPEHELTGDLALHILRSYLSVMTDRDSVPPFIHPKYRAVMETTTSRPSPLSAAIRLAKMLFLGRRMNRTLIWRLIRMEQERLLNDHQKFDKWETLEALQSLALYIIMRINEGRHDYTNFDTQLLISMNAICRCITAKFGMLVSADELKGKMIPWKDWMFLESRRRCATVILIIDSILHARIAEPGPAMPDYAFAPAPSPRALWDAENELDWAIGYAGHLHTNAMHGMLRNGDLVALKEAAKEQDERWYAYADSFGILVTLAANLIV